MICGMLMTITNLIKAEYNCTQDKEQYEKRYREILNLARRAGYRKIDVTSEELNVLGVDKIFAALQSAGMRAASYIYLDEFANSMGKEKRIARTNNAARDAVHLQTDVFMVVTVAHSEIEKMSREEIHTQVIEHWKPATEYATELGLKIAVEATPDLRLHLCKAEDLKNILENIPKMQMVYDTGNVTLTGETSLEHVRKFISRICYVHVKDMRVVDEASPIIERRYDGVPMAVAPVGTGVIDIDSLLQELYRLGYGGEMTVEFMVDDNSEYYSSLKRCFDYMQNLIEKAYSV